MMPATPHERGLVLQLLATDLATGCGRRDTRLTCSAESGALLPQEERVLYLFLGDAAFPLLTVRVGEHHGWADGGCQGSRNCGTASMRSARACRRACSPRCAPL